MKQVWRVLGSMVVVVGLYAVLVEGRHWRADAHLPESNSATDRAILVLGCPPRSDASLSRTQRWRVDMAMRCWRAGDRMVISGAALAGLPSEAEVMGVYAQSLGVPGGSIVLETAARSTWENILLAGPHLDGLEVMVVSDPLHARRAVAIMQRELPALASRVVRPPCYRPGEHPWRKTLSALFESPLRPLILRAYGRIDREAAEVPGRMAS